MGDKDRGRGQAKSEGEGQEEAFARREEDEVMKGGEKLWMPSREFISVVYTCLWSRLYREKLSIKVTVGGEVTSCFVYDDL